jgi:hypothetical protein
MIGKRFTDCSAVQCSAVSPSLGSRCEIPSLSIITPLSSSRDRISEEGARRIIPKVLSSVSPSTVSIPLSLSLSLLTSPSPSCLNMFSTVAKANNKYLLTHSNYILSNMYVLTTHRRRQRRNAYRLLPLPPLRALDPRPGPPLGGPSAVTIP